MTIEQQDAARHDAEVPASPGLMLKQAREACGLSQQEVATRLNLRLSLIRQMEDDNFDPRTAATFTRGYLRSYAKLVGIDGDAVVAAYEQLGLSEVKSEMHSFSRRTSREASENRLRAASWIFFVLLAVALFAWWWQQPAEEPQTVTSFSDSALMSEEETGDETSAPAPELSDTQGVLMPAEDEVVPEVEAPVPSSAAPAAPLLVPEPAASPAVVAPDAVPEAEPAAPAASAAVEMPVEQGSLVQPASAEGVISLRFRLDCWLKITDAKGKVVLEGLKKAGSEQQVMGPAPFKLVIGAPGAVEIAFRNEPVDMGQFKAGQVARFMLPFKS